LLYVNFLCCEILKNRIPLKNKGPPGLRVCSETERKLNIKKSARFGSDHNSYLPALHPEYKEYEKLYLLGYKAVVVHWK
jgi:hypothetical protein